MNNLHNLIQQSYETLLKYAGNVKIILLHPHSRYRSLAVAKLLAQPPRPVFYYSMGPYDVNIASFLSVFVYDLAEQAPTFGRHLHALGSDLQQVDREQLLESLLQDIAELSDEPFFLILDEYDTSENANDVQEFMEQVLLHLPDHCQVVINSRHLPRLPWVALVAQNRAVILNDDSLIVRDPYRLESGGDLARLKVQCLGPNSIAKDDNTIEGWEGHLPRLLFVFALERPMVTRTEICQSFWPNLDNDQAVNVFHVTKRRLHKALGFDALVHQDGYYQVNPQISVQYDVIAFTSALVRGRIGTGDEAAAAWQEAIDLYQGPFLQGHTEEWIIQQRQAYQIGYLEAMMSLANIRVQGGRPDYALRILIQASNEHAGFEPLHQEIMKLYAALGRRSEAASHYQNLVESLAEKGSQPSPSTQQLYQELMS
jgi:DNA-binding SARP family transcriptional activator